MKETEQLILKAVGRDPDAFTELVQLQMKKMYRTAYAILLNDEDAADAIQDTILVLWEKIPTLQEPQFFQTWCTRILINRCYNLRKKRKRETSMDEVEGWTEQASGDSYNLEWKEALSVLEEKYRIPIELFYGQGYQINEIAGMLNMPASTVRTRLARGRERMAQYYRN